VAVRRLAAFFKVEDMTLQRMDDVAIVVDDLDAAIGFFSELGMELEGKGQIEGLRANHTVGLDGVRSDIAMMRTPDGHSKLELTKYHTPAAASADPQNPPPNTLGLHRVMFAVDDIDDTIARLRTHGAELLGEVAQYERSFRLCYLRGRAGIIVALAEQIGENSPAGVLASPAPSSRRRCPSVVRHVDRLRSTRESSANRILPQAAEWSSFSR
jgi:catechol 2,3-dioxygenase-like lactoylglutathione lyase family enzyme